MIYTAKYGIDGGVSHGFGLAYPDYIEKLERITADDDAAAVYNAAKLAASLSRNHLCNPTTNKTSVSLIEIVDSNRRVISQQGLIDKMKLSQKDGRILIECSSDMKLFFMAFEKVVAKEKQALPN